MIQPGSCGEVWSGLDDIVSRWFRIPCQIHGGAFRQRRDMGDAQTIGRIGGIGVREIFRAIGNAISIEISDGVDPN